MPTTTANKMKTENNNNIDYNNNKKEDDESLSPNNFVPVKNANKYNNNQPKLEYNNKTAESYRKNGLEIPENLDGQQRNFLSKVSVKPELSQQDKEYVEAHENEIKRNQQIVER